MIEILTNERGADWYDENWPLDIDRCSPRMQPVYDRVIKLLEGAGVKSVLEIGCGHGFLGEMIMKKFAYRGIDLSPFIIEECKKRYPDMPLMNAGVDNYPIEDETGAIVATEVLEHLSNDVKTIGRVASGTVVVATMPHDEKVPDQPDGGRHATAHVRGYIKEEDVVARYGDLLDINYIDVMNQKGGGYPTIVFRGVRK